MKLVTGDISVKESISENISFGVGLIMMVLIPVYHWYIPPFMVIWGIWFILTYTRRALEIRNTDFYARSLFTLFILFFVWQIVGMTYSDNPKEGWRNLELRLSLLLFPLAMISPGKVLPRNRSFLLKIFVLSTFSFLLFCYLFAILRSFNIGNGSINFNPHPAGSPWLNYFFASEFAIFQHTTYLSMFTLMSVFIAAEFSFDRSTRKKIRILWMMISLVLLISIYFLSSRSAILAGIISVPIYLSRVFKIHGRNKYVGVGIVILVLIFVIVSLTNPRVNNYFLWRTQNEKRNFVLNEDRFKIWSSFGNVLRDKMILGVGTGDIQDKLNQEYIRQGYYDLAKVNTNTHNQFAEVLIENGIIGLLLFLGIFVVMVFYSIRENNVLYLMFVIIVLVPFLFETMLNRLAGVSFFSLFSFLLLENRGIKKRT